MKTYRKSSVTYYIIGQSLADIGVMLVFLIAIILSTAVPTSSIGCKLRFFCSELALCWAMNFICLCAFDRWVCTSKSLRIRKLSSTHVARILLPLSLIPWLVINIPFLIYCDLELPELRCWFTNELFENVFSIILGPIVAASVPLLLIIFSLLTYQHIGVLSRVRQFHRRIHRSTWDQQMTKMILTQTLLSISCTMPRVIFVIYSMTTKGANNTPSWNHLFTLVLVDQLTNFIMGLNFSSSLYIYLVSSPRLRQTIGMYFQHVLNLKPNNQINPTNTTRKTTGERIDRTMKIGSI